MQRNNSSPPADPLFSSSPVSLPRVRRARWRRPRLPGLGLGDPGGGRRGANRSEARARPPGGEEMTCIRPGHLSFRVIGGACSSRGVTPVIGKSVGLRCNGPGPQGIIRGPFWPTAIC
uniref:Uncharacterized protein n=1 Tax=Oryza meridionalis TaxID=40149 RepID=A0A0E0CQ23_9ORYZ